MSVRHAAPSLSLGLVPLRCFVPAWLAITRTGSRASFLCDVRPKQAEYHDGDCETVRMAEPACLASNRVHRRERQSGNLVVRRRFARPVGGIGLEAGELSRRRQGRGRLSSAERRLARRSAHERQAFRRTKNLLEPRLRRRQRLYSCAVLDRFSIKLNRKPL